QHGGSQIEVERILQYVTARARPERLTDERIFAVHAEHEDRGVGRALEDRSCGDETVDPRHRAIHDDHARRELCGHPDRILAVLRFADDFNRLIVFEQTTESSSHEAVIVHEQYGDLRIHIPTASRFDRAPLTLQSSSFSEGTRNLTSVPP